MTFAQRQIPEKVDDRRAKTKDMGFVADRYWRRFKHGLPTEECMAALKKKKKKRPTSHLYPAVNGLFVDDPLTLYVETPPATGEMNRIPEDDEISAELEGLLKRWRTPKVRSNIALWT